MHPYLIKLGVPFPVQEFFEPAWRRDGQGNILFDYPDATENYGLAWHRVPVSAGFWLTGQNEIQQVAQVFISTSAMEAIAYLSLNFHAFPARENLLFIAYGSSLCKAQVSWLAQNISAKPVTLIVENNWLSQVAALKMAAGIRKLPVAVFIEAHEMLRVRFRLRDHWFTCLKFTLNRFEKAAGFRFGISTAASKTYASFLEQLRSNAFTNQ
jgi:hypothetical protein